MISRIVRAPGLALQRLTTQEPDQDMLEVAIISFQTVLSDPAENIAPSVVETLEKDV